MRRLWPKYDKDGHQQINEKDYVIQFIEHSFQEAKLLDDLLNYCNDENQVSLEDLIYKEARVNPLEFEDEAH